MSILRHHHEGWPGPTVELLESDYLTIKSASDSIEWLKEKVDPKGDHCEVVIFDMMGVTTISIRPIKSNTIRLQGRGDNVLEAIKAARAVERS